MLPGMIQDGGLISGSDRSFGSEEVFILSLDSADGDSVTNSADNLLTANRAGSASQVKPTLFSTGLYYDGTDDYMQVPVSLSTLLPKDTAWSISTVIYPGEDPSKNSVILGAFANTSATSNWDVLRFDVDRTTGKPVMYVGAEGQAESQLTPSGANADQAHGDGGRYTITADASNNVSFYFNDVLLGTDSFSSAQHPDTGLAAQFEIGATLKGSGDGTNDRVAYGSQIITDLKIWTGTELTSSDVSDLTNDVAIVASPSLDYDFSSDSTVDIPIWITKNGDRYEWTGRNVLGGFTGSNEENILVATGATPYAFIDLYPGTGTVSGPHDLNGIYGDAVFDGPALGGDAWIAYYETTVPRDTVFTDYFLVYGDTVTDDSGSATNGTKFGPVWVGGAENVREEYPLFERGVNDNGSMFFAGGDIELTGSSDVLVESETFATSTWVKIPSGSLGQEQIVWSSQNGSNNGRVLQIRSDNTLELVSEGGTTVSSTGTITADTWHHVVVTRGNTGITKIYLDNVEVGSTDIDNRPAGGDITIGNHPRSYQGTSSKPLSGWIDQYRLWARPLTGSEISDLYSGTL